MKLQTHTHIQKHINTDEQSHVQTHAQGDIHINAAQAYIFFKTCVAYSIGLYARF